MNYLVNINLIFEFSEHSLVISLFLFSLSRPMYAPIWYYRVIPFYHQLVPDFWQTTCPNLLKISSNESALHTRLMTYLYFCNLFRLPIFFSQYLVQFCEKKFEIDKNLWRRGLKIFAFYTLFPSTLPLYSNIRSVQIGPTWGSNELF